MPKCFDCDATPAPNRSRCEACLQRIRRRYAEARDAGRCVQTGCPNPAQPGRARCAGCHALNRERAGAAQRKARAGVPHRERPY